MSKREVILLAGGSGLLGTELASAFKKDGNEVRLLGRSFKGREAGGLYYWNPANGEMDAEALKDVTILINLAGESVAGKLWTDTRKDQILGSRVDSVRLLADTISVSGYRPQKIIQASAVGIYGAKSGSDIFTEETAPASDFLASVCTAWENEAKKFEEELNIPLCIVRIGVVLASEGGALYEIVKPMKFAVGAVLGTGRQWVPWIHIVDIAGIFNHLVKNRELTGVFNAVSPNPVNFEQLTRAAAKSLNRFVSPINVPAFALKIALGEQAVIVLEGTRVSADKIETSGYAFQYPHIQEATDELLAKN